MTAALKQRSSIRLDPAIKSELDWYFGACHHDLGVKSNFGPMIDRIAMYGETGKPERRAEGDTVRVGSPFGSTKDFDPFAQNDKRLGMAGKYRRIRRALMALDPILYAVIVAMYEPERLPAEVRECFDAFAGVAVHTRAARRGAAKHDVTPREWLASVSTKRNLEAIAAVMRDVELLVTKAHEAYAEVRDG